MRVRTVTVAAINNLSICWETMRERDSGAGSDTKNIDLAFVQFIWSETRRTTRKGFFWGGGVGLFERGKSKECLASSHSDVARLLQTKSNGSSPPHCCG